MLDLATISFPQSIPEVVRTVSQEDINLYAQAAGDFNPIHLDPEFAQKTSAKGIIAHGMLVLAYVSQMMANAFGQYWLSGGKINVRFKEPARPGDRLTVTGKIEAIEIESQKNIFRCSVLCSNQKDETVIIGEAAVKIDIAATA